MPSHPFASVAFLSGLPPPPPGGGLSGELWPVPPRRPGALWPVPPEVHAAQWPSPPHSQAAQWPVPPHSQAAQWPVPPRPVVPGVAADADANAFVDPRALLGLALRQSRARVLRQSDTDDGYGPGQGPALWRWAPDSRVRSVVCEVLQRFVIEERSLLLLDGSSVGGWQAHTLYTLPAMPLDPEVLDDQVDKVLRAAVEREDRLPEILAQAQDIGPFYESITGIHFERAPILGELMAVAQETAVHLVMLLKHRVAMLRPVETSTRVMPVIATPGHGSLPSGHATLAALSAELLNLLLYDDGRRATRTEHLDRLARRIAFNRVVAGVHFPVDSQAGYALGTLLARMLAVLAGRKPHPPQAPKAEEIVGGHHDLPELPDAGAGKPPWVEQTGVTLKKADALHDLWSRAATQLDELRT